MSDSSKVPPGALLLASPDMLDGHFMHSVVLIGEHDEEGAWGLIVNRPTTIPLDSIFDRPESGDAPAPTVHEGGPVGQDRLHLVHRRPDLSGPCLDLCGGVHLGGDVEQLLEAQSQGELGPKDLRVILGYAGWGPGQLEEEFATGAWFLTEGTPELVFQDVGREAAWRRALRSLGARGRDLGQLPPDASWN